MLVTNRQLLNEAEETDQAIRHARERAEQSIGFYRASKKASFGFVIKAIDQLEALKALDHQTSHDDFRSAVDKVIEALNSARGQRNDAELSERAAHEEFNTVLRLCGKPSIDYDDGEVHCSVCNEALKYNETKASWYAIEGTEPYECRTGHGMHVPA